MSSGLRVAALGSLALLVAAAYAGSAHQCFDHPGHTCHWGLFIHAFLPDAPPAPSPVGLEWAGWCERPSIDPAAPPADRLTTPARAPPRRPLQAL